ncbi:MAG: hypothetical protein H0W68_05935 [Gemmatimonadaceae bacterium]|nr:hypothetical protein [Gemmatimonadaceae bacterium]
MKPTDEFQYLTVLVSIILGLGLTQLLTGVGRLVQARARVRAYWPALMWVGLLLLFHVQVWWAMFDMRAHQGWTFLAFLVVLLTPTSLYLMVALVLPDVAETTGGSGGPPETGALGGRILDLRAHYYAQRPWFFGAAAAVVASSLLRPVVMDGRLPLDLDRAIQAAFLALLLGAAWTRRAMYHEVMTGTAAALFGAYVVLLFGRLR